MHALGGEVFASNIDILAGHLESRALTNGVGVVKTGRDGDHHPAFGDFQVDRLVEAVAAVFEQDVLAGDAEVGSAVLHVRRRVGGADNDQAHIVAAGGNDQLARGFRILEWLDAGGRQKRQRLFKNSALREGDGDAIHGAFPARQRSAHSTAMPSPRPLARHRLSSLRCVSCGSDGRRAGAAGRSESAANAVHRVNRLAVDHRFDQAVDVGFEAREAFIEIAREAEIANDGGVETLARDE
jgi:hypothetical protein